MVRPFPLLRLSTDKTKNNMNFSGYDPVLQPSSFQQPDLGKATQEMQQKLQQLQQHGYQVQPVSPTPVWDEIDRITRSLSEKEFSYLNQDKEFAKSQGIVEGILTREYLKVMRPIVEQTTDGKEALKRHLSILQDKVKEARNQSDKRDALFSDYMTNHSDMTFDDYLKMKGMKK